MFIYETQTNKKIQLLLLKPRRIIFFVKNCYSHQDTQFFDWKIFHKKTVIMFEKVTVSFIHSLRFVRPWKERKIFTWIHSLSYCCHFLILRTTRWETVVSDMGIPEHKLAVICFISFASVIFIIWKYSGCPKIEINSKHFVLFLI